MTGVKHMKWWGWGVEGVAFHHVWTVRVGEGESMKAMAAGITLGRVATGEDVAAFVSYLAGPDSN